MKTSDLRPEIDATPERERAEYFMDKIQNTTITVWDLAVCEPLDQMGKFRCGVCRNVVYSSPHDDKVLCNKCGCTVRKDGRGIYIHSENVKLIWWPGSIGHYICHH